MVIFYIYCSDPQVCFCLYFLLSTKSVKLLIRLRNVFVIFFFYILLLLLFYVLVKILLKKNALAYYKVRNFFSACMPIKFSSKFMLRYLGRFLFWNFLGTHFALEFRWQQLKLVTIKVYGTVVRLEEKCFTKRSKKLWCQVS